jgi:hypothetical protein
LRRKRARRPKDRAESYELSNRGSIPRGRSKIMLVYRGSEKPKNALTGEAYFDGNVNAIMVFDGSDWMEMVNHQTLTNKTISSQEISKNCRNCGAPPSYRKCEYCGSLR